MVTRKKIREPLSPTVLIKEKFDSSERVGERRQGNDLAHIDLDSSVHSNVIRTIDLKVDKQQSEEDNLLLAEDTHDEQSNV